VTQVPNRVHAAILLAAAVLAPAGSAHAQAQASAQSEAQALALFKQAVVELKSGNFAAACPRFDAAMKLFPSPSTELNLARCFEHDGKVASAWAAYQRVLVLNRDTKERQRYEALDKAGNDGAMALQGRLPRVRIAVPAAPPGLKVTEDGQELPAASFGMPLPVDPGEHALVATAPGYGEWRSTVTAVEGKTSEVSIALAADAPSKREVPSWAWVVGGVGVVSLGFAAGFGVDGLSAAGSLKSLCQGGVLAGCTVQSAAQQGQVEALNSRKDRDLGVFIGTGAVGAVAVTVAVATVLGGGKASATPTGSLTFAPVAGRGFLGAGLAGGF
jgi:hypothetical protein